MIVVRDSNGNPIVVVDGGNTIEAFFYHDKLMRIELKKQVPESLEIFVEKIQNGVVTAENLVKYAV